MSPLQAPTDVFTVRETDLLARPPALTSGLFGGVKGALRIPSLSFQYPRRPGCTAKLLCFPTRGGFESHRLHQPCVFSFQLITTNLRGALSHFRANSMRTSFSCASRLLASMALP